MDLLLKLDKETEGLFGISGMAYSRCENSEWLASLKNPQGVET